MKIVFRKGSCFKPSDAISLYQSVGWHEDCVYPERLMTGLYSSSHIVSAWAGNTLVGIARSMDDGIYSANIDVVVVHRDYQNRGIGSEMVKSLMRLIPKVMYINVSPNKKELCPFYEKLGFSRIDNGCLLQIKKGA